MNKARTVITGGVTAVVVIIVGVTAYIQRKHYVARKEVTDAVEFDSYIVDGIEYTILQMCRNNVTVKTNGAWTPMG